MKVLDPGHSYEVSHRDFAQTITFYKDAAINGDGYPGILCQELLRVLMDRVVFLDQQKSCDENKRILGNLRDSLRQFELRAARLKVEKALAESWPPCAKCGARLLY